MPAQWLTVQLTFRIYTAALIPSAHNLVLAPHLCIVCTGSVLVIVAILPVPKCGPGGLLSPICAVLLFLVTFIQGGLLFAVTPETTNVPMSVEVEAHRGLCASAWPDSEPLPRLQLQLKLTHATQDPHMRIFMGFGTEVPVLRWPVVQKSFRNSKFRVFVLPKAACPTTTRKAWGPPIWATTDNGTRMVGTSQNITVP